MIDILSVVNSISQFGESAFKQLKGDYLFAAGLISGSVFMLVLCIIARSAFKPSSVRSLEKVIKTLERIIVQQKKDLFLKDQRIKKCHEELENSKIENEKLKSQIDILENNRQKGGNV